MSFISHRGAAGLNKENSLKAIHSGNSFNPFCVEIDIHRTKDNIFIIHHGKLHRTFMGIKLKETYEQLAKDIPTLLTLDEFIKQAPNKPYMLDVKIRTANNELVEALKKMPDNMRAIFTSPHVSTLKHLKQAFPKSKTFISQPYSEGPFRSLRLANKYDFDGICINKWWIGPLLVKACNYYNKEILAYTVDHPLSMRIIRWLFPNITIITNRPDKFRKLFPKL